MPKQKSKKQVGYLLSSGSPLSDEQKAKLKRELHSGTVKVKKGKKRTFPRKDKNGFY
jgi:hypothetical protein